MRYALMTEPQQGLAYEDILALARTAHEAGFETFFRSDHYTSFPGAAGLPTTDAWTTLAGLARETRGIGLGVLVSPVTFRIPGSFVKVVTTVDRMSGGRVEVGVGAGWSAIEHREHGIPFPDVRTRFDMLEEELAILHGMWTEPDGWSHDGERWPLENARLAPRPIVRPGRRHPNLIIGGDGKPRTARLVATYADEFNVGGGTPEDVAAAYARIRAACVDHRRDPDDLVYSAMIGTIVGATENELHDRVKTLVGMVAAGQDADAWLAERRRRFIIGTYEQALEQIAAYEAAGVQRLMLQDLLPYDLDQVRELGMMLRLPAA